MVISSETITPNVQPDFLVGPQIVISLPLSSILISR